MLCALVTYLLNKILCIDILGGILSCQVGGAVSSGHCCRWCAVFFFRRLGKLLLTRTLFIAYTCRSPFNVQNLTVNTPPLPLPRRADLTTLNRILASKHTVRTESFRVIWNHWLCGWQSLWTIYWLIIIYAKITITILCNKAVYRWTGCVFYCH